MAGELRFADARRAALPVSKGPVVDGSDLSILTPLATTPGAGASSGDTVAESFAVGALAA